MKKTVTLEGTPEELALYKSLEEQSVGCNTNHCIRINGSTKDIKECLEKNEDGNYRCPQCGRELTPPDGFVHVPVNVKCDRCGLEMSEVVLNKPKKTFYRTCADAKNDGDCNDDCETCKAVALHMKEVKEYSSETIHCDYLDISCVPGARGECEARGVKTKTDKQRILQWLETVPDDAKIYGAGERFNAEFSGLCTHGEAYGLYVKGNSDVEPLILHRSK